MDLTDAEDSKKRWQEYIEEVYRKVLCDPDQIRIWFYLPEFPLLQSHQLPLTSGNALRKSPLCHHYTWHLPVGP